MAAILKALTGTGKHNFKKSDTSEMSTKADYLLAFRTIITMLSYIQSPNGQRPTETGPVAEGKLDCKELKVLDTFW